MSRALSSQPILQKSLCMLTNITYNFVPWKTGICHLNGAFKNLFSFLSQQEFNICEGQTARKEREITTLWKLKSSKNAMSPNLTFVHCKKKRTCKACFLKKQSVLKANDAKRTLQLSKEVQSSMRLQENTVKTVKKNSKLYTIITYCWGAFILTQFISEQRRGLILVIFASVSPQRGLMFPKRGLMLSQRGLMIFWSKLLPAQEDLWSEKKMSWAGFEPGTFWLPVLRTTTELRSRCYIYWWKLQIHIQ